jgi:creatinine amidohydrolase
VSLSRKNRRLLELDSRSFERAIAKDSLLIVPVGALEAHGPHLPLGADQIQAEATAEALAERLDAWVAPALSYGACPGTRPFPGTVSLSMGALARSAEEVLGEFARMGVRRVLVLSGHAESGHMAALREAADRAVRAHPGFRVAVLSDYDFVYELRGKESPPTDGHGGLLETSRVMALAPHTVGTDRPNVRSAASRFRAGDPTPAEWPESVMGDTRPASPEIGRRVQEHVLTRLEATTRDILFA